MSNDYKRYFYHCFPRGGDIDLGLQILESICKNGLLLTPEVLPEFREALSNGKLGEPISIWQKRICFTELGLFELGPHCHMFGPFAIEWEIDRLREIGAMPVIYFSVPRPGEIPDNIGTTILARLSDLLQLTNNVNGLKNANPHLSDLIANIEAGCVAETSQLTATLQAVSGLLYPVENLSYTDQLGYYRQREWRITSNIVHRGARLSVPTKPGQVEELLEINHDFFSREHDYPSGLRANRATQSQYIPEINQEPTLASAKRIIVPSNAKKSAEECLEKHGIDLEVVTHRSIRFQRLISVFFPRQI